MILVIFIENKKIILKLCDDSGQSCMQVNYNTETSHADGLLNLIQSTFSENIKSIHQILISSEITTSPALCRVVYSIGNSLAYALEAQIAAVINREDQDIDYSKIHWLNPPLKMKYQRPAV